MGMFGMFLSLIKACSENIKGCSTNDIILVPLQPGETNLNNICPNDCKRPVFVTPQNINCLVKLLREKGIEEAAVAGKDCTPGNFALDVDGRVRCYGTNPGVIQYAFCYANYKCPPRPCPPCPPYPCPPRPYPPCPPYPCPPRPYPPCPPYPCPPRPFPPCPPLGPIN